MNITENITGIEGLDNNTEIKLSSLTDANNYLHVYGYLVLGPILIVVNTLVFLLITTNKALRSAYS